MTPNLRMLPMSHPKGQLPTQCTLEGHRGHQGKTEAFTGTGTRRDESGQTTKSCSCGSYGVRKHLTIMGERQRRLGFLKCQSTLQTQAYEIICGISRKRKKEPGTKNLAKNVRRLTVATHPVIDMILYQDRKKHQVKVLLDTGYSVALINDKTTERLGLKKEKHQQARRI